MQNDSLETLLCRHYGATAPAPQGLEDRLLSSVRLEATRLQQQQRAVARVRQRRLGRRQAVHLVALGTLSAGIVGAGMELLEAVLIGQDAAQTAAP